jgi:hypothetical protein
MSGSHSAEQITTTGLRAWFDNSLESLAKCKQSPSGEITTISAADPLNLTGIVVPGERVPAKSGKVVAFRDGVTVEADDRAHGRANVLPIPLSR